MLGLMMRALLFTASVFLLTQTGLAQNSQIKGRIVNSNNDPVTDAYVILGNNNQIDITDKNGRFFLSDLMAGTHSITISKIGYQTTEKQVEVKHNATKELQIMLHTRRYQAPSVVVTATRTRKDIEEVPTPVTVIKKDEIRNSGNTRLSDVLAEQTGLVLTSDHGTGVQVQGFDPEYTLIMIDGQPMIGRTAGTLDLSRISVGNIKQVEMMKGPSSALWGSDAMAGVINIITEKGNRPFEMDVTSRYGTNQTFDIGTNISSNSSNWQNDISFNRNSSAGYSLVPGSISQTVPDYENYTGTYRTELAISDRIQTALHARYYHETQQSTDFIGSQDNPTLLNDKAIQEDYSLTPSFHFNVNAKLNIDTEYHYSGYRTEREFVYQENDQLYQRDTFKQTYQKAEIRGNYSWDANHISTFGTGLNWEQLRAERYKGNPDFQNIFIFGQHEWLPSNKMDLIAGFRYDAHSEYTNQFSPKFSARYELFDWFQLRGSVGRGFKAPDFRQLFLNFSNPTVGYTVLGSSTVKEELTQLDKEGKIDRILLPLDNLSEITAERSWAYNVGFDLYPLPDLQLRINAFRNNVDDLIETAPIAEKTNGQSVYSYFNLEQIYTQGIETQIRWNPISGLNASLGYQLLDARRQIQQTQTVQDENGNPIQKEISKYEPMFNRSKHSANIKLFYHYKPWDIETNIRGRWHGRYGRFDANGNGFVDSGEYEEGYTLWNSAVAKTFADKYKIQFGIDNIFDFTRPQQLSYLPGRIYYAQISLQLY
ncbi:TonB-dependent receptor [Fodinibius sp. Rm-B-1B1-1]|uniref:TonB-dependent receptor n=1 Tax=Fodinibius alkaliphilus TaxID=3140241 RepID=UPI00315A30C0